MKGKHALFNNAGRDFKNGLKLLFKLNLQMFGRPWPPKAVSLRQEVSDQKLLNFLGEYYRPGAEEGDGGLADAIKKQLATGELVGGRDHLVKGRQRIANIRRILKSRPLAPREKQIAESLLAELIAAFGGTI